jgi:hypothetical protein
MTIDLVNSQGKTVEHMEGNPCELLHRLLELLTSASGLDIYVNGIKDVTLAQLRSLRCK